MFLLCQCKVVFLVVIDVCDAVVLDDARTNIAIALSVAENGADIANYVEMTEAIFKDGGHCELRRNDRSDIQGRQKDIRRAHETKNKSGVRK